MLLDVMLQLFVVAAFDPHVFVVTSDLVSGNTAAVGISAPWPAATGLEPVGAEAIVRHFFGKHYVVNRDLGTIQVIDPVTFSTVLTFSVGEGSRPQDILVVGKHKAYVSRSESTLLLEVDPTDGSVVDTIDLSAFADADGLPEMSMMALDGKHLFVQLQRRDHRTFELQPPGYIAVIDVSTNALVDASPTLPGIQPVRLAGLNPSFRMFVERSARRLLVSEPADFCCEYVGGIDEIHLDQLRSLGFITTEEQLQTLDLGAFTMISPDEGYVVTHTEIVESTHVTAFSREKGTPTGQAYSTIFGSVRSIAHDPSTEQVFLPDFTDDGSIGVVVFDALTDATLTSRPIDVGMPPTDLVIARPVTPGEAHGLRVVSFERSSGEMAIRYEPACEAEDHSIVFGALSAVGTYGYAGAVCGIGNLGEYEGFVVPLGSTFFLVVGATEVEGSYGVGVFGERPGFAGCGMGQDLTLRCDPVVPD